MMPVPLTPDFDAQRLYDSVDLVSRVGDRSQQQLCVMSLVALLAGERHSDRPDCACAVITAYAIKLNDALDDETRQVLKPFAPRIIGTRDGYEAERARFMVGKILCDLAPRLIGNRCSDPARLAEEMCLVSGETPRNSQQRVTSVVRRATRDGEISHSHGGDLRYLMRAYGRDSHELVATATAVLLANCARLSNDPQEACWFWNYATDLLDRTCDIGISATRSVAEIERMSQQAAAQLQVSALKGKLGFSRKKGSASIFRSSTG